MSSSADVWFEPPSAEVLNAYRSERGVTESSIEEAVEAIQSWIKKQPHLPDLIAEDTNRIRALYHGSKFSVEVTKQSIDNFYTLKASWPDVLGGLDPQNKDVLKALEVCPVMCMPKPTTDGYRVVIIRPTRHDPSFDSLSFCRGAFCSAEMRVVLDQPPCLGDVYIWDLKHTYASDLAKFTPSIIQKLEAIVASGYKVRIKALHFLNTPSAMSAFLTAVKALIKPKLAERIQLHANLESLQKCIPKESLPNELGGQAGPWDELYEKYWSQVVSVQDKIKTMDNINVLEANRPCESPLKSKLDAMDATHGNFRLLEVD